MSLICILLIGFIGFLYIITLVFGLTSGTLQKEIRKLTTSKEEQKKLEE
jgi:hypothetical protein